jgi:ribonuclease Y
MFTILFIVVAALISFYLGYFVRRYLAEQKTGEAEAKARAIIDQAHKDAETRLRTAELESKDLLYKMSRSSSSRPGQPRLSLTWKSADPEEENIDRSTIFSKEREDRENRQDNSQVE